MTAIDWARANAEQYRFRTALNRAGTRHEFGTLWLYRTPIEGDLIAQQVAIIEEPGKLREADKSGFLLDIGTHVVPFYVAGWHAKGAVDEYVIIHPIPPGSETSPRRFYHLKLEAA